MVVLHPSRSKCISTRSAEAFWDERIAGFLPGEKPPKMQFWRLMLSIWFFLFYSKEVSLSIRYHMIRCILFAKSKQGTHCTTCKSARNCIFGHLHLYRMSSILFFQNNCIFHLNIVGTRQATIRNRITEKSVARSDGVTSSHTRTPQ